MTTAAAGAGAAAAMNRTPVSDAVALTTREKGDGAGAEVWKRVENAIEELEKAGYEPEATKR
jgi:hypothetical protein